VAARLQPAQSAGPRVENAEIRFRQRPGPESGSITDRGTLLGFVGKIRDLNQKDEPKAVEPDAIFNLCMQVLGMKQTLPIFNSCIGTSIGIYMHTSMHACIQVYIPRYMYKGIYTYIHTCI
jgi:hypothetical protein